MELCELLLTFDIIFHFVNKNEFMNVINEK